MAFHEWISILVLHWDGNLHLRRFMLPFDVNQKVWNGSLVWIVNKETRRVIGESKFEVEDDVNLRGS
jgi:hypothetical protein